MWSTDFIFHAIGSHWHASTLMCCSVPLYKTWSSHVIHQFHSSRNHKSLAHAHPLVCSSVPLYETWSSHVIHRFHSSRNHKSLAHAHPLVCSRVPLYETWSSHVIHWLHFSRNHKSLAHAHPLVCSRVPLYCTWLMRMVGRMAMPDSPFLPCWATNSCEKCQSIHSWQKPKGRPHAKVTKAKVQYSEASQGKCAFVNLQNSDERFLPFKQWWVMTAFHTQYLTSARAWLQCHFG